MKPPWLAAMLTALRATGSMVEARKAADVNASTVTEACNADDALAGELETARQAGLRAKRGGAGGGADDVRGAIAPAVTPPEWAPAVAASRVSEAGERPSTADARRARILAESSALGGGPCGRFLWLDARCAERGLTPTSPWWAWAIKDFFDSGKRWWFLEVGRGGSKSTTLERLAASLSMLEERSVPPGQTWEYLFISVGVDDANRRIRGLHAVNERGFGLGDGTEVPEYLRQRIVYSPRGHIDLVDIAGNEIRMSSIAGTIGAVSGPNSIGIIIDEAAKLRDKAVNANPLREIIASATATFRARPNVYAIVCSSPWRTAGAHYEAIHGKDGGDNEVRHVARIGQDFLGEALEGLEAVAAWEEHGDVQRRPNAEAARVIRAHARSLTARSPNVPTWVALPELYGATPTERAIRLRVEVQSLPPTVLDGLPQHMVWLREIAGVPLDADEGPDYSSQCILAAEVTERLADRFGGQPRRRPDELIKVPGARPGDARYAGPPVRTGGGLGVNWRKRGVL